ncbi:MAG: GTPase, partial [Bacteroidaceae bacterium]
PFLLSDTVGFIRKLPTDLVDSFKSTLDEVREADILLHLVDISHSDFEEQITVVERTLADLDVADKPSLLIFNKIDAYTYVKKEEDDLTPVLRENWPLEKVMQLWTEKTNGNCMFISAKEKLNMDAFKKELYSRVKELHIKKYPYNNFLFEQYTVEE